jgi:hypothetical protein
VKISGNEPLHVHQKLPERIEDGHVEMREIAFVPGGPGKAVNASRDGYH